MTATVDARRDATLWRLLGPGSAEAAVFALSLVTGPVVSRAVGEAGRGSLAAVLVPTQLVGWFALLGVPYSSGMLSRRVARAELLDGAWRISATVVLPACAALWVIAPTFLAGHEHITVVWFRVGLVGTALSLPAMTVVQLQLMRHGGSWRYSLARSAHLVGYTVAVVALASIGQLTLGSSLASWICAYVASRVGLIASFGAWPRSTGSWRVVRQQLRVGKAHAAINVATTSLGRIDQVVMAVLSTSNELGAYAIAATAAQVSLPVAKGVADVVLPHAFAGPYDGDLFSRALATTFVVSAGIGGIAAALAPWVLPWVFGDEFSSSVRLLWLLLPGQVLFNAAWVVSARHLGRGRPGVAAQAIVVSAMINAALLVPAVQWFGPEGAAALTSVCQGLFLAGLWWRRDALGAPATARGDRYDEDAGAVRP